MRYKKTFTALSLVLVVLLFLINNKLHFDHYMSGTYEIKSQSTDNIPNAKIKFDDQQVVIKDNNGNVTQTGKYKLHNNQVEMDFSNYQLSFYLQDNRSNLVNVADNNNRYQLANGFS